MNPEFFLSYLFAKLQGIICNALFIVNIKIPHQSSARHIIKAEEHDVIPDVFGKAFHGINSGQYIRAFAAKYVPLVVNDPTMDQEGNLISQSFSRKFIIECETHMRIFRLSVYGEIYKSI
jgi:hypothetical protein